MAPGSAGGATAGNHSLGGGRRRRAQSAPRSRRGEGEHAGKSGWEQQASWRVAAKASKRAAHAFSAGDLLSFDPENNPPPSSATGWATSSGCRHGRPHTGRKSFGHLHGGGGGRAGGGVFPEGEMSFRDHVPGARARDGRRRGPGLPLDCRQPAAAPLF